MSSDRQIPADKRLSVIYSVEAGCLGPDGAERVDDFCRFAQACFGSDPRAFAQWQIVHRYDKSKPEIQYQIKDKNLSADKASDYLALFETDIKDFEEQAHEKIGALIEKYLGR